ncbi:MAG: hypothetical protein FJ098_04410 [Deltaproteobacteria bacterium]|nr:hypothetical protein [Deltaproteobacteria bacterium]
MKHIPLLALLLLLPRGGAAAPDPCTDPGTETWTVFRYATLVNDDNGGWDFTGWAKYAPDGQLAVNTSVDPWETLSAGGWDFCDPPGTEAITKVKLHALTQQTFPSGPAAMVLSAAGVTHAMAEHAALQWDSVDITTDQAIWTWGLVNGIVAHLGPHLEPGVPKIGCLVDAFKLEVTFTACGPFETPVCWENDVWLENSCGQIGPLQEECQDGNPCTTDGCANTACYHNPVGSCCLDAGDCDDGNACTDDVCTSNSCQYYVHAGACDDEDACTDGDVCVNTACIPGLPLDCDDGNACTDDVCDPASGCASDFNLAPCDDGSDCTVGDHCEGGVCTSGAYVPGGACGCITDEHCPDDMNQCNGKPACLEGYCQTPAETVKLCTDAAPEDCLEPVCNPANGLCQDIGLSDGSPCADTSGCHTGSCQAGACQLTDFAECAGDGDCPDDDDPCNGAPMCGGCACVLDPSSLPDCDDGNACTADFCDQVSGDCLHDWAEGCCNDSEDCPGGTCVAGACVEGCGDITYEGLCDGTVLFWCEDGELQEKDCGKSGLLCLYDEENGDYRCKEGTCSCTGRVCGDDGCGGSCGECKGGEVCSADGTCVPEGTCLPDCEGRACGSDGCDGSCGECGDGETCDDGACVEAACVPDCTGRECGDDGCGGDCGLCDGGECTQDGACVCPPDTWRNESESGRSIVCEALAVQPGTCATGLRGGTGWAPLLGLAVLAFGLRRRWRLC